MLRKAFPEFENENLKKKTVLMARFSEGVAKFVYSDIGFVISDHKGHSLDDKYLVWR